MEKENPQFVAPGREREAAATCRASVPGLGKDLEGRTRGSVPGLARELPSMPGPGREVELGPSITCQSMKGEKRIEEKQNKHTRPCYGNPHSSLTSLLGKVID